METRFLFPPKEGLAHDLGRKGHGVGFLGYIIIFKRPHCHCTTPTCWWPSARLIWGQCCGGSQLISAKSMNQWLWLPARPSPAPRIIPLIIWRPSVPEHRKIIWPAQVAPSLRSRKLWISISGPELKHPGTPPQAKVRQYVDLKADYVENFEHSKDAPSTYVSRLCILDILLRHCWQFKASGWVIPNGMIPRMM